jgi:Uma2 family endonuclease
MSLVDVLQERFPIVVPAKATTHDGFRNWLIEERADKPGLIAYLGGDLFIDMGPEELETHNNIRTEVGTAVYGLNKRLKRGTYYASGALVSNRRAKLSTEPDGTFVLWATLESGRVRLPSRGTGEFMELLGSPDWIMEVVSESSLAKDTQELPDLYHKARVGEYWLINPLGEEIDFQILRWQKSGYKRVPIKDGWQRSPLFGCWFRLTRQEDRLGDWEYTLEARE